MVHSFTFHKHRTSSAEHHAAMTLHSLLHKNNRLKIMKTTLLIEKHLQHSNQFQLTFVEN